MLRTNISLFAVALAMLFLEGGDAAAARERSRYGVAPMLHRQALNRPAMIRAEQPGWPRRAIGLGRHDGRFGHWRGRPFRGGPGFFGPGYLPGLPQQQTIVLRDQPRERPYDPDDFAQMPIRIGIPNPPTPNPTLYRIEGSRERPVTRVIRIADAQPPGAARSRHVHAETGALLLTVPGR